MWFPNPALKSKYRSLMPHLQPRPPKSLTQGYLRKHPKTKGVKWDRTRARNTRCYLRYVSFVLNNPYYRQSFSLRPQILRRLVEPPRTWLTRPLTPQTVRPLLFPTPQTPKLLHRRRVAFVVEMFCKYQSSATPVALISYLTRICAAKTCLYLNQTSKFLISHHPQLRSQIRRRKWLSSREFSPLQL